jgi:hypothetical protein
MSHAQAQGERPKLFVRRRAALLRRGLIEEIPKFNIGHYWISKHGRSFLHCNIR